MAWSIRSGTDCFDHAFEIAMHCCYRARPQAQSFTTISYEEMKKARVDAIGSLRSSVFA
jgi:hypothetical protein